MKSLKQAWDRSLPRPVGETGRRSVGNGKERLRDYAGFPDRQPQRSLYHQETHPKGDNIYGSEEDHQGGSSRR